MTTSKLTLYIDETVRTRVKVVAAHSNKSLTDFLLPAIEGLLAVEEEKMRARLLELKPPIPKVQAFPAQSVG